MRISLDAIQFDHEPGSATGDALTIRRDATREVVLPEWRRGACVGPEDSPAAYAISETRGRTITIKARFRRLVPGLDAVEVRALDATAPERGRLAGLLERLGLLSFPAGNALGAVAPATVRFGPGGLSEFQSFRLTDTNLEALGVGAWTTAWRWQYRARPGGPWVDFDRSEHRTFVLLEAPKEPWTQQSPPPPGLTLPRVDALEFACRWAQGSRTRTEAAAGVTRGIFSAGPDVFRYDRPGQGGSSYFSYLTLFLERLRGGEGNGVYVNCNDCANHLTMLANLLGCELWSSQVWDEDPETFETRPIAVNPMILIGEADWSFPFPDLGEIFLMHQVAIDGEGTADDHVFDACLMVDGDDDPTKAQPARTPLLPQGLRFVAPGALGYRERFAAPEGRRCAPLPEWRARFGPSEPNAARPGVDRFAAAARLARAASSEWIGARAAGPDVLFFPFDLAGDEVPGWRAIRVDRSAEGDAPSLRMLLAPDQDGDGGAARLRVEVSRHDSRAEAQRHLALTLGRLEAGPPPRLDPPPVGDAAFGTPGGFLLAFARGNLAILLANAGPRLVPVDEAARAIDRRLTERPEPTSGDGPPVLRGLRFFADRGDLEIKDGRPVLHGVEPEGAPVARLGVDPSGRPVADTTTLGTE